MTRKTAEPAAPQTDTADDAPIEGVTAAAPAPPADLAAEPASEQPGAGGSYVRQADGSLKRMEFTAEAALGDEADAAPADPKTPIAQKNGG